jgi:hypothetical protein
MFFSSLYAESAWFQSRPEGWPSLLIILNDFPQSSQKILGMFLQAANDNFLLSNLTVHEQSHLTRSDVNFCTSAVFFSNL